MSQIIISKQICESKSIASEIDAVEFSILSKQDVPRMAEFPVYNRELYVPMSLQPMPFGVLDPRLGAQKKEGRCSTCGSIHQDCCGHWAYISLFLPVFHVGYMKHLINVLYCICKKCSALLMSFEDKQRFLKANRRHADALTKKKLFKAAVLISKKNKTCRICRASQGVIKKLKSTSIETFMKLTHTFVTKDDTGKPKAVVEALDPIKVRTLLSRMSPDQCDALDLRDPEKLLISSLLVPPTCIRPTVTLGDAGTNEDDLTIIMSEIVDLNNSMIAQAKSGQQTSHMLSLWELVQLHCTRLINSDAPGVAQVLSSGDFSRGPGRGICQRLKGKEGRFRGNLSGKRVDFSGRTVISPDPNCPIDSVIVPVWQARRMTFPEMVCGANYDRLIAAIKKGADEWPGAAYVLKKDGNRMSLKFANRHFLAEHLEYGDIVERHMRDGDICLFNRQPSLHRQSIMAHKARVMPWRTLRFNECVCTPYNADFDGDEMNIHLPQTLEARSEAYHLMGVVNNLCTGKNGEPLVAANQDFLSGSYMLTHKDTFLTRKEFCSAICYFTDGLIHIDLPPPSIMKPIELWTGKQIFNVLIRPNRQQKIMLNFAVREREYVPKGSPLWWCPKDGYVLFYKSELLSGSLGKKTLGGSKEGLFFFLIRDNNQQAAAICMGRVARLAARWFCNRGMTIGIDDVTPSSHLKVEKNAILEASYTKIAGEIDMYEKGYTQAAPGCTIEATLENKVKSILDDIREKTGKVALDVLPATNKPLVMFLSGAKGQLINIAQMINLVGQQNVGGQRIQYGFEDRTLPCFSMRESTPISRGFVANSFFNGLHANEFWFHTMGGREGLVDTAVKTADTGYMQRKLVKALEDLSVCYDRTVRTSDGQIVQFVFGDDGLNPSLMEDFM
eukprot:GHVP01020739.1.p1 GENE.GHVP01020739.1~~GHVP01020739.1.p1  ORF type:complete len:898 (-),score=147.85 GHVP01020739.1:1013-3706(-)